MNSLFLAAYHHAYSHGGGWADWIAHSAVSALIHAVIYGTVFKLMHRLTLGEAVVLALVVVAVLFIWGRSRDGRR
ncbi:MAG TPA: hypothetical protein VHO91_07305 [Rhodopila sp.]|nr:hypothetical protein [Rhodopila sp.]